MRNIENIFQDRGINYGGVMVLVVFVLSGLAFGSMASISVFLKPVSWNLDGLEARPLLHTQLLRFHLLFSE